MSQQVVVAGFAIGVAVGAIVSWVAFWLAMVRSKYTRRGTSLLGIALVCVLCFPVHGRAAVNEPFLWILHAACSQGVDARQELEREVAELNETIRLMGAHIVRRLS